MVKSSVQQEEEEEEHDERQTEPDQAEKKMPEWGQSVVQVGIGVLMMSDRGGGYEIRDTMMQ